MVARLTMEHKEFLNPLFIERKKASGTEEDQSETNTLK